MSACTTTCQPEPRGHIYTRTLIDRRRPNHLLIFPHPHRERVRRRRHSTQIHNNAREKQFISAVFIARAAWPMQWRRGLVVFVLGFGPINALHHGAEASNDIEAEKEAL